MKKVCIKVDQHLGEQLRLLLVEKELLDPAFPITQENRQLFFPIKSPLTQKLRKELEHHPMQLTFVEKELAPIQRKPPDLVVALEGQIPPELLELVPHSLDIIGDIAIVEVNSALKSFEIQIGKAITQVNPRIKTVYAKEGGVEGVYRIRPLRLIAGQAKTTTIHLEYGIRLAVDVTQTYFSPRLATEHDRVTALIQPNEVIVDMFAGIGPFAILAAARHNVKVFAIDINNQAIQCLQKSLKLNRLIGQVIPILGDARTIIQKQLKGQADRVIMNLPNEAFEYLDAASTAIKPQGGIIHFYGITTESIDLEELGSQIRKKLADYDWKVKIVNAKIVRPSAPHEFQSVFDLEVVPSKTNNVT